MLGIHLRLHAGDASHEALVGTIEDLAPSWPRDSTLMLLEFDGAMPERWPDAVELGDHMVLMAPSMAAGTHPADLVQTISPNVCVRARDSHQYGGVEAKFLAIGQDEIGGLRQFASANVQGNILALDIDEPIDHARATHAGAIATSGWSCARWKRRPADKKVGMLSNILKLIQLIDRDADTADIEALLKRDAVLSYTLISMANSAAYGVSVEVTSIRHALNLLGRHKLKRWLSLLLLHSGGADTPQVLLQLAFIRASVLERLGADMQFDGDRDDLFLCGAFSLLDKILGIPLTELLGRISISDGITDALIGDEGPLAPLLAVVRGLEARDPAFLRVQCEKLAIRPDFVGQALLGAIAESRTLAAG
jgi:EAL and modified HD-GYP domain-containing signal transduction protein